MHQDASFVLEPVRGAVVQARSRNVGNLVVVKVHRSCAYGPHHDSSFLLLDPDDVPPLMSNDGSIET